MLEILCRWHLYFVATRGFNSPLSIVYIICNNGFFTNFSSKLYPESVLLNLTLPYEWKLMHSTCQGSWLWNLVVSDRSAFNIFNIFSFYSFMIYCSVVASSKEEEGEEENRRLPRPKRLHSCHKTRNTSNSLNKKAPFQLKQANKTKNEKKLFGTIS